MKRLLLFFQLILGILFSLTLVGCFKEDEPMKLQPSALQSRTIGRDGTGGVYDYECYYDFSEDKITEVKLGIYDLAFDSRPGGIDIRLNTGKFMFAWKTREADFKKIFTSSDLQTGVWETDVPSGFSDSLAMRGWFNQSTKSSNEDVYIIDRGSLYYTRSADRYRKVIIRSVDDKKYLVHYGLLTDTIFTEVEILKDNNYALSYLNLEPKEKGGGQVKVAPPKNEWDIVFTNYIHIFPNESAEFKNYLVRGTLSNFLNQTLTTAVERDFDKLPDFKSFKYEDLPKLKPLGKSLSVKANAIGYDWKIFNMSGNYVIPPKNYYLVQDREGSVYKLKFTDFYSIDGKKGFPQFEFDKL